MIGEVGVWVADRLVRLEKVLGKIEGLWAEVQFIRKRLKKREDLEPLPDPGPDLELDPQNDTESEPKSLDPDLYPPDLDLFPKGATPWDGQTLLDLLLLNTKSELKTINLEEDATAVAVEALSNLKRSEKDMTATSADLDLEVDLDLDENLADLKTEKKNEADLDLEVDPDLDLGLDLEVDMKENLDDLDLETEVAADLIIRKSLDPLEETTNLAAVDLGVEAIDAVRDLELDLEVDQKADPAADIAAVEKRKSLLENLDLELDLEIDDEGLEAKVETEEGLGVEADLEDETIKEGIVGAEAGVIIGEEVVEIGMVMIGKELALWIDWAVLIFSPEKGDGIELQENLIKMTAEKSQLKVKFWDVLVWTTTPLQNNSDLLFKDMAKWLTVNWLEIKKQVKVDVLGLSLSIRLKTPPTLEKPWTEPNSTVTPSESTIPSPKTPTSRETTTEIEVLATTLIIIVVVDEMVSEVGATAVAAVATLEGVLIEGD